MIAYKNATILTMDNKKRTLTQHALLVQNGKIVDLTTNIPNDARVINLQDKWITPGLIDAHTHVGLWAEITEYQNDANEYSDPWTPGMQAIDGLDYRHFSFNRALQGGVTTVQTGAGSANPIGGVWMILKTAGENYESRILVRESGLKGAFGENPKNVFGISYGKKPMTRMAVAQIIRNGFLKARSLTKEEIKRVYEQNDVDLIPFLNVLKHKMPLRLHCHRADDIATAIRIAKEFNVPLSLEHCTEGHLMIDAIKESGAAVTLGPYMGAPSKYEVRNMTSEAALSFVEADIPFAVMTDHPFIPIQYLIYCAAELLQYGISQIRALQTITIDAAKLMNIDERVGSLEKGKDADFVIWSHHPFSPESNVEQTYINGELSYEKK